MSRCFCRDAGDECGYCCRRIGAVQEVLDLTDDRFDLDRDADREHDRDLAARFGEAG